MASDVHSVAVPWNTSIITALQYLYPFTLHDAPPDPLVGWGGGQLPLPSIYKAVKYLGASILALSAFSARCSAQRF